MGLERPLWAPWRVDFIRSAKPETCFLCGKNKEFESPEEPLIVARGVLVFALMNRYPYNSGHLLIAPYRHIADLGGLTVVERGEMMEFCALAKAAFDAAMRPDGVNIGCNLGVAAGAGVADHVHMHAVPRWIGDTNFMPVVADLHVVPESIEATAALLRDAWRRAD